MRKEKIMNEENTVIQQLTSLTEEIEKVAQQAKEFLKTEVAQRVLNETLATEEGQRLHNGVTKAFGELEHEVCVNMQNAVSEAEARINDPQYVATISDSELNKAREQLTKYSKTVSEIDASIKTTNLDKSDSVSTTGGKLSGAGRYTSTSSASMTPTNHSGVGRHFDTSDSSQASEKSNLLNTVANASQKLNGSNVTEADRLAISELAYMSKFGRATSTGDKEQNVYRAAQISEPMTVEQYCDRLIASIDAEGGIPAQKEDGKANLDYNDYQFLKVMKDSPRYKDLVIDYAEGTHNGDIESQIICVTDGNGYAMFGIEGTNGTIVDWANNGLFADDEPTKEELYVYETISNMIEEGGYDSVDIMGHSQGGREAVTTAILMTPEQREKLNKVYNFDGPGYFQGFLDNYADEIEQIKGYVEERLPTGSFVGRIGSHVGNLTYFETIGEWGMETHSSFTWSITNGELASAELSLKEKILGDIYTAAFNYVGNTLDPVQAQKVTGIVFTLMRDDKDPTKIDFGNIVNHLLDEISFGDAMEIGGAVATVILQGVSDVCDKICDICSVLNPIAELLSLVCPEVFAPIAAILDTIETVAKITKIVCDITVFIIKAIARWKEEKRIERRETYIKANPQIEFYKDAFEEAAACLIKANDYIKRADADINGIECKRKRKKQDSEGVWHTIVDIITSFSTALSRLGAWIDDMLYLKNQPLLTKGAACCEWIAATGSTILKSANGCGNDNMFTVIPSSLSAAASYGSEVVGKTKAEIAEITEAYNLLGQTWKAEDFTSIKSKADQAVESYNTTANVLANDYEILEKIAGLYASFQSTCIDRFDAAGN